MFKTISTLCASCLLLGVSQIAGAQAALEYFDCEVENAAAFQGALGSLFEATRGGSTGIFLDQWAWNGEDAATHRVIIQHADYAAMDAWRGRFPGNAAAQAALASLQAVSDCGNEGLSIFRGAWGNFEAQAPFFAVYNIAASDGAAYAEALTTVAEAQSAAAPGQIILFENRAGQHGVSHIVAISGPTLAALNSFLDTLFASDDFADFNDDVRSIRTVVSAGQSRRVQVWVPPQAGN